MLTYARLLWHLFWRWYWAVCGTKPQIDCTPFAHHHHQLDLVFSRTEKHWSYPALYGLAVGVIATCVALHWR